MISGDVSFSEKEKDILSQNKTQTKLSVVGGNSEYANSIENNAQYIKWVQGITNQPVLCGFDENSLVPIWELCSTQERKEELYEFFHSSTIIEHPLPILHEKNKIFEGSKISKPFVFYDDEFQIHKDCATGNPLTGAEPGDFTNTIKLSVTNGLNWIFRPN